LFGPPGAGKGTQAELIEKKFGAVHISTGDILREAVANGTEIGKLAKSYMDRGELVPDEVVIDIAIAKLQEIGDSGFLLDGFPRTVAQAEALDKALSASGIPLDTVISLNVPEEEIVRRLSGRRVCTECGAIYHIDSIPDGTLNCLLCGGKLIQRADDNPESIRNRLRVYDEQTSPVLDYYRGRGILVEINAVGTVEEVFCRLMEALCSDKA